MMSQNSELRNEGSYHKIIYGEYWLCFHIELKLNNSESDGMEQKPWQL